MDDEAREKNLSDSDKLLQDTVLEKRKLDVRG
jgi:hypothetical protein